VLLGATSAETARVLVELGAIVLGLAVLARLAGRLGFSPIPLYLIAGLAFGEGGILSLGVSLEFIGLTAEIGVLLLLLVLGLEYSAEELQANLRGGVPVALVDLALNAVPGFLAGLLLGWSPTAALLLGGVTWISSSGIVAKVLGDLGRLGNRETPAVLSVLVLEDLAMAVYLPVVAVLVAGAGWAAGVGSVSVAIATVVVVLWAAMRFGQRVSDVLAGTSDESLLLSVLGLTLLVAGAAQRLQVSAAVGAFLVGIALSGPVTQRAGALVNPLRDLFAATFFLFFGLQIDPGELPAAAPAALALAVVTAGTKVLTGRWAARRIGAGPAGQLRAGAVLVARGEFSIVIAGLGVSAAVEPQLGPLAAAYVLVLAIAAPVAARLVGSTAR
jgi:monovalent cation:H+ antiporter-2, CPA2 family